MWNYENGRCERVLPGHTKQVNALQLLPGNRLASGASDCRISIWNLSSGEWIRNLTGHSGSVNALKLLDNGRIVSASHDMTIKVLVK